VKNQRQYIVAQFAKPRGALGHLAGVAMANRPSNRARNDWTVDLLELEPDHTVLEFGCGPGIALKAVLDRTNGFVTGIDHSKTMIAQSRSRNKNAVKSGRLRLIEGSLDHIPGNQTFDWIYSINVIQFMPDKQAALAAAFNRLAVGGRIVTTYMPRHQAATAVDADAMADTLTGAMQTVGFQNIRRESLPLRPVPAVAVIGTR
jgi:ubiquinone/menaquinone biosynthesis C-methylase UbiE